MINIQFEEHVKFELKQLEKFIFENKEIPIVNQINRDNSRNDRQHPGTVKLPKIVIKKRLAEIPKIGRLL